MAALQPVFVDTNIFLRHLLNDDPVQSPACRQVFTSIEQKELVGWTTALTIAEIVFVASNPKTYAAPRASIRDAVLPLIRLPNLRVERKTLYPRIFDLFVSLPIDYVDAYHAALIETSVSRQLISFDRDFDRVSTVERNEPQAA